ncbi:MAG TPA: tetratricopeptide repeat protein, partial [Terriglobales bacterium]
VNPVTKDAAARVSYLKGRALRQDGDLQGAAASFNQSLISKPNAVEPMLAISEIYAVQNKHAESFAMLEKARARNPKSVEVLRPLIAEAMRAGQNDKALEAALELQNTSSELGDRYLVASVMLQQKQFLPASHILEDYVAQRPDDARAFLGLGMAYLGLLRYADAQQALERSLQLKSDLAEADYQLGLLFAQQGSRQEAIEHWQKTVELQPHHAQALFSLGTIYLEAGELEKARLAFQNSLSADSGNMKAEYDLALVLNKLGNAGEAKQHFERYRKMQTEEHNAGGNPATEDRP